MKKILYMGLFFVGNAVAMDDLDPLPPLHRVTLSLPSDPSPQTHAVRIRPNTPRPPSDEERQWDLKVCDFLVAQERASPLDFILDLMVPMVVLYGYAHADPFAPCVPGDNSLNRSAKSVSVALGVQLFFRFFSLVWDWIWIKHKVDLLPDSADAPGVQEPAPYPARGHWTFGRMEDELFKKSLWTFALQTLETVGASIVVLPTLTVRQTCPDDGHYRMVDPMTMALAFVINYGAQELVKRGVNRHYTFKFQKLFHLRDPGMRLASWREWIRFMAR